MDEEVGLESVRLVNGFLPVASREVRYERGPADGRRERLEHMPSDGVICFFVEDGGRPVQAVYRLMLCEVKGGGVGESWEWVAEYMGQRRYLPQMVNGVRKVLQQ